jgi:IS4 transposase
MDKGYNDYHGYKQLTDKWIFFVSRLKTNAKHRVVSRRSVLKSKGLTRGQTIGFTGLQTAQKCPVTHRYIGYKDAVTGKQYTLLINSSKLSAKTIVDIYKSRWQVELFFKWIKQDLEIKTFVRTNKNAVVTQLWIALCMYRLLSLLKFQSRLKKGMQQILRLLQLSLFEKLDLLTLLQGNPIKNNDLDINQLVLLRKLTGQQ